MTNPNKYRDKYRIPTARWVAWDYAAKAAFFVTICTANRTHEFGEIMARDHDRVIRDTNEYKRIHLDIQTNPQNWIEDRFFPNR